MRIRVIIPVVVAICIVVLCIVSGAVFNDDLFPQDLQSKDKAGSIKEEVLTQDTNSSMHVEDNTNINIKECLVVDEELQAYPYDTFMNKISTKKPSSCAKVIDTRSYVFNDLDSFDKSFPEKNLYKINDECVCAEYRLERNGSFLNAFVVFEKYTEPVDDDKKFETWMFYREVYFAYPSLESTDFADFKGDKNYNEIPFVLDLSHTLFFNDLSDELSDETTLHSEETIMLKDGFMIIDYYVDTSEKEIVTIAGTTFVPYGATNEGYPYNSLIKNSFLPNVVCGQ